jgi:hypothetical protein
MASSAARRNGLLDVLGGADGVVDPQYGPREAEAALALYAGLNVPYRSMLRLANVAFSAYMIGSMYTAGLDRRFGDSMESEIDKIRRAVLSRPGVGGGGPNAVVDFAFVGQLMALDARWRRAVRHAQQAPEEAMCRLCDDTLVGLLAGEPTTHAERGAASRFLFQRGASDPTAVEQERFGKGRALYTASVETYVCATLCDPYAYGLSGTRAVHTFLAFLMLRYIDRAHERAPAARDTALDRLDWQVRKLRLDVALQNLASDGARGARHHTQQERARVVADMESLDLFKSFIQCIKAHNSDEARPTAGPTAGRAAGCAAGPTAGDALYAVVKATYIVHFAAEWLDKLVRTQLQCEAEAPKDHALTRLAPRESVAWFAQAIGALDPLIRELQATKALFADKAKDETTSSHARTRAYDLMLRISDALDQIDKRASIELRDKMPESTRDKPGEHTRAFRTLLPIVRGERVASQGDIARVVRALERQPAENVRAAVVALADALMADYKGLDDKRAAYVKDSSGPDVDDEAATRARRLYTIRPVVAAIGRVYSFMYRLLERPGGAGGEPPVILAVLRKSGWTRSAVRGEPASALHRSMLEHFTETMARAIEFCYDASTSGELLLGVIDTLRVKNLRLMGEAQRQLLHAAPACHPFRFAEGAQYSLTSAVAAQLSGDATLALPIGWAARALTEASNTKHIKKVAGWADVDVLLEATFGASRLQALNRANDAALQVIGQMDNAVDPEKCTTFHDYEQQLVAASLSALRA